MISIDSRIVSYSLNLRRASDLTLYMGLVSCYGRFDDAQSQLERGRHSGLIEMLQGCLRSVERVRSSNEAKRERIREE